MNPETGWIYNQSPLQAFYMFQEIHIDSLVVDPGQGPLLGPGDVVGAFNDGVCVGWVYADALDGGGIYDVDIADTDADGHGEVWVNTWDNFSMAIFEASGADTYVLAADLDGMFADNDPGSFNRTGFAFVKK